jgi:7,8-dihydroneopterin 2',3'-cyclic phosphate phosphodiesterase
VRSRLLNPRVRKLANRIRNKDLRLKVIELLQNPTFEANGKMCLGISLDASPAGLSHHHSYEAGLIEHILSTANIALALCDSTEDVYRGKVNRDIVIAGVLVHDVFKTLIYSITENGRYVSTDLADRLDHLSLATAELTRRGFPLELVHVVTAHHGEYGPIRPRTVEALICHLADFADSRFNGEVLSAATYLARRASGSEFPRLTAEEALEIIHAKTVEGWTGVQKVCEKIEQRKTRKN